MKSTTINGARNGDRMFACKTYETIKARIRIMMNHRRTLPPNITAKTSYNCLTGRFIIINFSWQKNLPSLLNADNINYCVYPPSRKN